MADAPKFCAGCGSPLEAGQKFCNHCGRPVDTTTKTKKAPANNDPIAQELEEDKTRALDSLNVAETTPTAAHPTQVAPAPLTNTTQVMPSAETVQRTYVQPAPHSEGTMPGQTNQAASYQAPPDTPKTKRNVMIGIIVALGVIVLALVGFLIFSQATNNKQDATSDKQTTTQNEQQKSSSSSSSTNSSTSARDKALYNDLVTYYNNLETYDSKISTAATNFNNNYLKKDISTRSSYANSANSLLNSISSDYNALLDLSVSSSSEYYDCYNNLLTCYYDCKMRISVICDAWDISLTYSDPTGHEDTICQPLEQDRVDGNNTYYTEFKQVYPHAKPTAPRG